MTTTSITLTQGQEEALNKLYMFMADQTQNTFVLAGYSGCGKSTLIRTFLDQLDGRNRAIKLIHPDYKPYDVELTATTNKAAENLGYITGSAACTIHSLLGIRVHTDFKTGETTLDKPKNSRGPVCHKLIVVDEASFMDLSLMRLVYQLTEDCKFIFVGDPAQLIQVKSKDSPVFGKGILGAELTEVVRQAEGNPIIDLSSQFRHAVNTGEWPDSFTPDGNNILHLNDDDFQAAVEAEFSRTDWSYRDSKILTWTNKMAISYNQHINGVVKGVPHFQAKDYAVCNSFVSRGGSMVKTDQLVEILAIGETQELHGVPGKWYSLAQGTFFMPDDPADKAEAIKHYRKDGDYSIVTEMENQWIDLRAAFAQTVNKAQGSTYKRVFIDLNDISRCNNGDTLARMLYVAVSRASDQVIFRGDIA